MHGRVAPVRLPETPMQRACCNRISALMRCSLECYDCKRGDTDGEFRVSRSFMRGRGWRSYCHDLSCPLPVVSLAGAGGVGDLATGVGSFDGHRWP